MKRLKIRCAVVGASGYVGLELLRLLGQHPRTEVVLATSNTHRGKAVAEVFPHLPLKTSLRFTPHDDAADFNAADVFLLSLPHGNSFNIIESLLATAKVIDLSADYRLKNPADYEKWYGFTHPKPHLLKKAVYGLTELNRRAVRGAALVANPGCYPTGMLLAAAPLAKLAGIKPDQIIIDAKSGYSGAGRVLAEKYLFTEASGEFTAYSVVGHRHCPEMLQETSRIFGKAVKIVFTPHLIPVSRGILSTLYAKTKVIKEEELRKAYIKFYRGEPFVRISPAGETPGIREVSGTNMCTIGLFADTENSVIKVITAIDNLCKGAAGQAVQNMNLMFGMEETAGLEAAPLVP
ncbi:MAG: N-acetyl-gamma-glutamyl-phosphate reductase [bacterium]